MTSLILATHLHYNHDEFLLSYLTGQMSRWFWSIRTLWYQKLGSSLRLNVEGIIQQTPDAKSRTMKVSLHPLWKKLPSDISRGEREMIYEEVPWINGVAWIQWLGGGTSGPFSDCNRMNQHAESPSHLQLLLGFHFFQFLYTLQKYY